MAKIRISTFKVWHGTKYRPTMILNSINCSFIDVNHNFRFNRLIIHSYHLFHFMANYQINQKSGWTNNYFKAFLQKLLKSKRGEIKDNQCHPKYFCMGMTHIFLTDEGEKLASTFTLIDAQLLHHTLHPTPSYLLT